APPPAAEPPELTVSALTLVDGALAPVVRIEGVGLSLAEAVERAGELVEGRPGIPALVEIGAERQAARIPLPAVLGDEDGSGARPACATGRGAGGGRRWTGTVTVRRSWSGRGGWPERIRSPPGSRTTAIRAGRSSGWRCAPPRQGGYGRQRSSRCSSRRR